MKKGFTITEVIVSVSIMIVLLGTILFIFKDDNEGVLKKEAESLISLLNEAKSLSMSSKEALKYGVHIESSRAIIFSGEQYVSGGPNQKFHYFNSNIGVQNISLNGGGSQILFERLSGITENYGSIKLFLKNNTNSSTTIFILQSGVIE